MTKLIETFHGLGRVRLSERYTSGEIVLRRYQDYVSDVPTVQHADGKFVGMKFGDAALAMLEGAPLEIELNDGRKAQIVVTDMQGSFTVTGPLA